jgi:phosphoglycolate phosphatase
MALDQQPSPLFEGVVESLDAFRAEGYRLAVATGKARRGLDRVLKANGWEVLRHHPRRRRPAASRIR